MRKSSAPGRETATIEMVAERAGVSAKTVSRVINNERGVRAETRERVMAAIEQLDYQPNLAARGLAGDRSFLIGLFYDKPGDYLSEFQTGAVQRCRESNMHLMIEPLEATTPDPGRTVRTLIGQLRMEGVILLPPLGDLPAVRATLADAGMPAVHIAPMHPQDDTPSVDTDDRTAACELTLELINRGHRRIAFMLGRPEHRATEERYLGFADAMGSRGLAIDPDLVRGGNFEFAEGLECARYLMDRADRPTAIFASNDDMAAAAVCVARQMNVALPDELSVTGFDDAPVATMICPQLSTVRQPVRALGRIAADLIIRHEPHRRGWPKPIPREHLELQIILRDSLGAPRGSGT